MKNLIFLLLAFTVPAWAAPDVAAGRKLLAHYGWTCESNTVEMAYTLSQSLTGNPETHYQSASKKIRMDLSPAAGQEITIVRYTLNKRSEATRSTIYAHVAFFKNTIIGGWLSTNGPIAPGIAPLDDKDFGHDF